MEEREDERKMTTRKTGKVVEEERSEKERLEKEKGKMHECRTEENEEE